MVLIQWVEARDAAKHPTVPTKPLSKEFFWPKMSVVLRLKNPVLLKSYSHSPKGTEKDLGEKL